MSTITAARPRVAVKPLVRRPRITPPEQVVPSVLSGVCPSEPLGHTNGELGRIVIARIGIWRARQIYRSSEPAIVGAAALLRGHITPTGAFRLA